MAKKTAPKKSEAKKAPAKKAKAETAIAETAPAKKALVKPSVIKTGFDARNRSIELLQIGSEFKSVNTITGEVRTETTEAKALEVFDQMCAES